MKKQVKLSFEQQALIEKVPIAQLQFFRDLADNSKFEDFKSFVNMMIDMEKEQFFGAQEYDERKLAVDHAFSRGGIAMMVKLLKIIAGSAHELDRRTEKK